MSDVKIGVIGGSGLYQMPGLTDIERREIETPFGTPSGPVVIGTLSGKRVAFLPRHGEGHVYPPSQIPQRANIYALKSLGVKFIIAVNACGSLKEALEPGHIVIPDQIVDYTLQRAERTFFDTPGLVAHISVADPFDALLRKQLYQSTRTCGGTAHDGGSFLIEDGPRFATRAESHIFQSWGCSIIGMTTVPEAFLALEAEIAYASMAHITDYDSWHQSEVPVNVEMVMATFSKNIELAQKAIAHTVANLDENATVPAHSALDMAIMTAPEKIPAHIVERLGPLLKRALSS